MIEFRKYDPGDVDAVVAIFRSNIPKYFTADEEPGLHDFLRHQSNDYYLLVLDGVVVGAGGIALNDQVDPATVSLCWGMVRADHLGTGLGRKLTEFRIDLSRTKHPGSALILSTSQHTEGFYRKLGFVRVEHKPNGCGPGIDICRMRLEPTW